MKSKKEFGVISLADALEFIVDNRGKTAPVEKHGIPLIATNCVSNNYLYPKFENIRYVSQHTYKTWFRSHPKPGDIILTNKGSQNGAVCLVPDPVDFCIAQDMVALRANSKKVFPLFLFAALRSKIIQNRIKQLNVDAVIPHFKKTDFDKLLIPLPKTEDQHFIGQFYFDISKKIELNRQINQTLEEMARSIFKSWFVDFEPVRAKIAAKAAGQDPERTAMLVLSGKSEEQFERLSAEQKKNLAETAALFPDEMQDSELGEIPRGWEIESLSKIADYLNGVASQKYPAKEGEEFLPVIKISEMRNGISERTNKATTKVEKKYIVENGDILFSWSGSLMVQQWSGGKGLLNQHIFKVTSRKYPKWFYFYWTLHHLEKFQAIAADKAVTMGHIKRGHLDEAKVVIPEDGLFIKIDSVLHPFLDMQLNNSLQNKSLAEIRDSLLPKLLSGEITV